MDEELFLVWLNLVFVPYTKDLNKKILILDVHGSHISKKAIDSCIENNIVLYCFPPQKTNVLQPLDVSVFRSFKNYFSKTTDHIKIAMFMKPIKTNKTNFTTIFKDAIDKSVTMTTTQNKFRKCGIYPFDRNAIDKSRLMPSNNNKSLESTIASVSASNKDNANESTLPDVEFQVDQSQNLIKQSAPVKQLKKHPLVTNGLISQDLVDILTVPHVDNAKSNTKTHRYITKARVLTAASHQHQIKEKDEERPRKEQARIDRELKRTAKKNKRNTKDPVKYLQK